MKFIAPNFNGTAFNCPHCNAYAQMAWSGLYIDDRRVGFEYANCIHCGHPSLWLNISDSHPTSPLYIPDGGTMVYPDVGYAKLPADDMPEDVKKEYVEAASIYSKSPRGAAALLRLGLQKLLKHLGEKGENINDDIRALAEKGTLSAQLINVADTIRLTGNNAVHPGEMSDEDVDHVAEKMFGLLNHIVEKGITEPKELDGLYGRTPESKRLAAEQKDREARDKQK